MKPAENIEKLIKNLDLDIDINEKTDKRILKELIEAHEKSQKMHSAIVEPNIRSKIMKNPISKLAAVIAVVLGLGAISVVGVNIGRKYYYKGKSDDGHHIFISDDLGSAIMMDDNGVNDVEQTRRDLEEIEHLRQQDKRELLKVEITMTDGTLEQRVHVYKYELSDGRIIDMREGVHGGAYALSEALWEEWCRLKKAGPGEELGTYEETVEGRVFSFKRKKYLLTDGTEVIWSVGTPK